MDNNTSNTSLSTANATTNPNHNGLNWMMANNRPPINGNHFHQRKFTPINRNPHNNPQQNPHNNPQMHANINCSNCGKRGHIYKFCRSPHMSYGILCFYQGKLILIQRKHSIGYIEFLRGKYTVENEAYIVSLLESMTRREREFIANNRDFVVLRTDLGMPREACYYKPEYDNSLVKYDTLVKTGKMDELLKRSEIKWEATEWGIPKGRRNENESDLDCAVREFGEETGINTKLLTIHTNIMPITESYLGTNGISYKHIYYIATIDTADDNVFNAKNVKVNLDDKEQTKEINDIRLMDYEEAMMHIRPYYEHKKIAIRSGFEVFNKYIA